VADWTAKIAAAFHSVQSAASRTFRRKVNSTSFTAKNGGVPFNASGVVQVGPRRFVFIDNHDSSALFEFVLDADDAEVEGIRRRRLVGVAEGQLGDPEGLTRVDVDGETFLIAASSLGNTGAKVNDGLVRVRYTPEGDLFADAMDGFRSWLLSQDRSLDESGELDPDAGGLNIEGITWDPRASALLFGQRGPAEPGRISMIQIPVDAGGATVGEHGEARPRTGGQRHVAHRVGRADGQRCPGGQRGQQLPGQSQAGRSRPGALP